MNSFLLCCILAIFAFVSAQTFPEDGIKKNVLVLYTGGTIGMKKTPSGYEPASGFLEKYLRSLPAVNNPSMPNFKIKEYNPLIDSSAMKPSNWLLMANDVAANYQNYDGFVVVHGTDTMAYTASALSFLLENLNKTVIVTGSQIPVSECYTDGTNNLIGSLLLAAHVRIPEVAIFFDNRLVRGTRSMKLSAWDIAAFGSPETDPLATIGVTVNVNTDLILPMPTKGLPVNVLSHVTDKVSVVYLVPGITGDDLLRMAGTDSKGVVFLAFGTGNGPTSDPNFLSALKTLQRRGVVMVDATQCVKGVVNLGEYAIASGFAEAGVVGAFDMTPMAAFTKLSWLLSKYPANTEKVKQVMVENIRGELNNLPLKAIWEIDYEQSTKTSFRH
eukprot:TRINITY_DN773068_c0_g1_i1.p1 TRINITY_DN773068_c0_g1~~TRINITY_DN773068_c0_g1_i1.p1  ORF type:complete len:386 (-),score=131.76 TRINITY_DN773068_c0_g1_i1:119-1276(-)